jgi:hypothetical protein
MTDNFTVTTVLTVPAPPAALLVLSAVPVFGIRRWMRRRQSTVTA